MITFALSVLFLSVSGKSILVHEIAEFNKEVKTLQAGDSVVLSDGIWKDAQLIFKGLGEKGRCICMVAETPGKVFMEGTSSLRLSGQWLLVSGLVFRNGQTPGKTVVDFRTSSRDYAYNSVLSNCVVDNYNQKSKTSMDHWVGLWGKNNRVEYCYFGGKTNEGTTLVIWPNDSNSIHNGHLVYRNYFGYRPPLGINGGETIRIGTSDVCDNISGSIISNNYFERCNGEGEIISNKSGENKFLNNTFFECEGSLTLRHGNRAIVSGNWFLGNEKNYTGGVRIINEGHLIYNNFFCKLRGEDFRSALCIMNGIPNTLPSGYAAIKNVVVANNTFYDCTLPWNLCSGANEKGRTVRPESTLLINNLVYCPGEEELITSSDNTDGINMDNNLLIGKKGCSMIHGSINGTVQIQKMDGLVVPTTTTIAKALPFLTTDITGGNRKNAVLGAFQNEIQNSSFEIPSRQNCGPLWYKQ